MKTKNRTKFSSAASLRGGGHNQPVIFSSCGCPKGGGRKSKNYQSRRTQTIIVKRRRKPRRFTPAARVFLAIIN
jgi:hypothetical protein